MNRQSPPTPESARTGPGPYSDAAFDAFVQLNFAGWVRYAHLHVGSLEDAEPIASEVVLQLHETWAHVLGHLDNASLHALALLRAEIERRQPEHVTDHLVENAAFLRAMDAAQNGFALLAESLGVYSAVARLPERRFQVVLLRFVLGYSVKETALRLGLSASAVSGLAQYARRALARELGLGEEPANPAAQHAPIDALLADLGLLEREYRGFAAPPTAEILSRAGAVREERAGARTTSHPAPGALAGRSESEQARHELNLAATLVLHLHAANGDLAGLASRPYLDPDGALILACLMQLSGRRLAARFWFTYSAGGGHPDAAYCLYLAHRAGGEFHDADKWRRQAARLRRESTPGSRASRRAPVGAPPQLAREVRSLLAQCYRGGDPKLSAALEATIKRLGITDEDRFPDAGPRAAQELIRALVPRD